MGRGSLARRYAPLVAVGVLQLLIIAVVPSKAPNQTVTTTNVGDTGTNVDNSGNAIDATTGQPIDAATGAVTGAAGGAVGSVVGGALTQVTGIGGAVNDISHCVSGREFDPAIDFYAPLCVAKFTGKNPGATYQGVTATQIEIVVYRDKGNDQVNDILKATGGYVYPEDEQAYMKVAEKFINSHYELYGRKVHMDYVQGQCESIPPNIDCLSGEMHDIVKTYHPYFVKWATTLCSACYEKLASEGTPSVGGYYFRDEYSQKLRPYHWDVQMSGTQVINHFVDFWCNTLKNKPVAYAGTNNPADNKNGKPRKLGVIGTDDDDNKAMIETNLANALRDKCNDAYVAKYEYKQDINTAATQKAAGVSAMNTNGATDVLCLCDQVAPEFLYQEENQENYYPENLIAGTGFMDTDTSGRSYDTTLCPNNCHEYENAFGLSQLAAEEKRENDVASRVWRAAGNAGSPPARYPHAIHDWEYFGMMASLIQATGPNLTPTNMEAAAWRTPPIGGIPGRSKRYFPRGQYAWTQDMRVVYWSPTKISPFDGAAGRYVEVDNTRHAAGSYAGMQFALPPKPR